MIGKTISHYRILEELGRGGMGIVYKAEDLKLRRVVAIKFLPKKLSVHGEERERFFHEAQAASALNHPNICVIHEVDEAEGETYLVMEYVEGGTLREWIQRKQEQTEGYRKLGIQEAVALATQIAEGLEKAHEKGIIHRDVKSENIMVTEDGRAKIMDFGLAKLRGVSKLTRVGSTIGTIAYMSPEQVEGLETDHRTDIFSFGVLFYEMLSGHLPFRAEHETAVMYEIMNVEPQSLLDLRRGIDVELNRIITKCLEKDRDIRYQTIRDVLVDLKRYKRDSEGRRVSRPESTSVAHEAGLAVPEDQARPSIRKWKSPLMIVAAMAVVTLIGVLLWNLLREGPEETKGPDTKITKFTSRPGLEDEPTWSPDGKFVAYTCDDQGNNDILVQPVTGGQAIRIVDSPADDNQPAWSPDGSKIAFVSARDHGGRLSLIMSSGGIEPYLRGRNGDIFLVPSFGGTPVKLAENGFDPAWSPDGKSIVFRSIKGGHWDLWEVPVEGGVPKQLTNDASTDCQPGFSPDGKWIVYCSGSQVGYYEVTLIPSTGGAPTALTNDKSTVIKPTWSPDGKFILFSSARSGSMNIWKAAFYSDSRSIGTPSRVTLGEGDDINGTTSQKGNTVAFAAVKSSGDIWELTLASNKLRQVSSETNSEDDPRISPDGKTLLVGSDRGGPGEIWTMDLDGRMISQLTSSPVGAFNARWSPDGKRICFVQSDSSSDRLFVRALSDLSVVEIADHAALPDWSADGKKLAFAVERDGRSSLWVYSFDTGEKKELVSMDAPTTLPSWSLDGSMIAFNTEEFNSRQVWVVSSSGGTPRRITSGESEYSHPQCSPRDKDVILCLRDHKNVCRISVSSGKVTPLTDFTESNIGVDYPSWSFDGQKVYFSLWKKIGDVYILENY